MRLALADATAGSQAEDAAEKNVPFAETWPALLARLTDHQRPVDIVPGLIPGNGIAMIHGQPRALKTWSGMEIARAVATQDAAFGLERFRVHRPYSTWYVSEEDPELEVRDRFLSLFSGRDTQLTHLLHLSVHKGIDLDDRATQAQMVAYAREHRVELTILDPIRSLTSRVDQGPNDLKPFIQFLRRYMRMTGSTMLLIHHDAKPVNGKLDARDRPQRMSGGGIFSATDAPIHAELLGGAGVRTLLTPARFKFAVTEDPFTVSIQADDPKRPSWVRIEGSESRDAGSDELFLREKIKNFLRAHPATSGTRVAAGVRCDKARVLTALNALKESEEIEFSTSGQARLWSIRACERE